jgi:hypothetical protein
MKRLVPEQYGITSLADAEKFAALTDRIVANLEAIDENDDDFDGLFQQTSNIVANLKFIEESNVNLNDLGEQTSNIVGNLKVIEEQR